MMRARLLEAQEQHKALAQQRARLSELLREAESQMLFTQGRIEAFAGIVATMETADGD